MTEIHVKRHTKKAYDVTSVVWTGDTAEGRLLKASGWIDGSDMGPSFDTGGPAVFRGIVGGQVAFPGDILVRDPVDGQIQVYAFAAFDRLYEYQGDAEVLSDGEETPSPILDSGVPTGINPNAVNLDVDQDEINRLISEDTLRELAVHADGGSEEDEDQLTELLKNAGWDPESDMSDTWVEMIEKVIASKLKIEPIETDEPPTDAG
jgi:hypothetical protein